jgi:type IV pilus assembly protein PilB
MSIAVPEPRVDPRLAAGIVRPRLGDVVVELGFSDRDTVEAVAQSARESGGRVGEALLEANVITSDQLALALAKRFGLERLDLNRLTPDVGAANMVPSLSARRLRAVPVAFIDEHTLLVAMTDPSDLFALDDLSMLTGMNVRAGIVSPTDLDSLLQRLSPTDQAIAELAVEELEETQDDELDAERTDDAPAIRLVRSIIAQAVQQGASDVHFDPEEGGLHVRYRIDGIMADFAQVPRSQAPAVISRIKILGGMDIAQRRLPQDGRIGIVIDDRRVDIRVSVVPLVAGEKAVLRVLDRERAPLTLDELGMRAEDRNRFEQALKRSHGAILTTGPTGSGKTTTLYAAVGLVRSPEKTVITIEDPVEYRLSGVSQIQVAERTGLTFGTALRAVVRSDPDVIMVGEIRDRESASIAIEAALTGHLVLSTLHTNDAPMTIWRLIDMGVEPYLVASSIDCIVAQRLARRLCDTCRTPVTVPAEHVGRTGPDVEIYDAVGCARCRQTGYRGRMGIYEVMTMSEELRAMVVDGSSADEMRNLAVAQGMRLLRDDGLAKVCAGETTLAELGRVIG